jgi:ADP-heptose:LPS heptosyltransferase
LATIFIGADTAELQLAAAVGTPCVGLFSPTAALENAPFGQEHRTVHILPEEERQKRKRTPLLGWLETITPEMVCEKCDEVLTAISQPSIVPIPMEFPTQKKAA